MSDDVRIEAGSGVVEVLKSAIPGHVVLRANGYPGAPGPGGVALRADEAQRVAQALLGGRMLGQTPEEFVESMAARLAEVPHSERGFFLSTLADMAVRLRKVREVEASHMRGGSHAG